MFRHLRINQRGQMAIFIALIFQILFLFFAMAINLGLVVHDKINLQNAVDLSAFYAGQRQAEMLNVIAHTNYQIRQSWKLLNWRYYVLGTLGLEKNNPKTWPDSHPSWPGVNYPHDESVWSKADPPTLCVTYPYIWESMPNDNPCKTQNFGFQNITIPRVVAPFVPLNRIFAGMARNVRDKIQARCTGYSGYNWFYAANIYMAFLLDQKARKQLIHSVARNMAKPENEILDLDGESIREGAFKTFQKNLTRPNAESIQDFKLYNSLEGLAPSTWLNEMDIWFTLFFQRLNGEDSRRCDTNIKDVIASDGDGGLPINNAEIQNLISNMGIDDPQILTDLIQYVRMARFAPIGNPQRPSLGVEKNPWYMAYMGVKASTKPRQIFFPFGEPVQFEARAFVQPFGGRIGPWYGRQWSRGANSSSGSQVQLSPVKLLGNGDLSNNDPSAIREMIPRYSKYPGDRVGLQSPLAQTSLTNTRGIRVHMRDYLKMIDGFSLAGDNDILAYNANPAMNIRKYEIAAIAPDLFDTTYYSIQPNFGDRFLQKLIDRRADFNIPQDAYPRSDLGARGHANEEKFSVRDQIKVAQGLSNPPTPPLHNPEAFWYIKDRAHLLTSWVHNDVYGDYFAFPVDRFGKCKEFDDGYDVTAPGSCIGSGGRSGYSVKLISPEMFTTPLPLGGAGIGTGVILNPPPDNW